MEIIKMKEKAKTLTIRRAEVTDKSKIMTLAALDHAESIFGDLAFSEKKFSTQFDKSLTQPQRCITLKAEVKGGIVGFLYSLGEYFIAEDNVQANVHVVYVNKDIRKSLLGGKVAVKLVKAIIKWAKAQGAQHVFFYVT